jgi:hypothetical protein
MRTRWRSRRARGEGRREQRPGRTGERAAQRGTPGGQRRRARGRGVRHVAAWGPRVAVRARDVAGAARTRALGACEVSPAACVARACIPAWPLLPRTHAHLQTPRRRRSRPWPSRCMRTRHLQCRSVLFKSGLSLVPPSGDLSLSIPSPLIPVSPPSPLPCFAAIPEAFFYIASRSQRAG